MRKTMTKIIISIGESNSGGQVLNSDATPQEVAPRPEVKIWNVTTGVFEPLDVGTNNNLDHVGLTPSTHGMELQLANDVAGGLWSQNPMYYVQTGHGGSKIAEWSVGNASQYWTKFLTRVNSVKEWATANSVTPEWIVWMTFGINDSIAGTNQTNWKTDTIAWINRIKAECPGVKILMTELTPSHAAFTALIRQIADSETDVTFVSTTGCALQDINHWSYAGMKTLSTRMSQETQIFTGERSGVIGSNFTPNVYPADRKFFWTSTANGGFISKEPMNIASPVWSVEWPTNAASGGIVVSLGSTKDTNHSWGAGQTFIGGAFNVDGTLYAGTHGGSGGVASLGPMGEKVRLTKSGNDLHVSKQVAGVWSVAGSVPGVLAGISSAFLHVINAIAGTNDEIELTVTNGFSITALLPLSGARRIVGIEEPITWSAFGAAAVNVMLSFDGGATYPTTIAASCTASSFSWTPTQQQVSALARIKIVNAADASMFGETSVFMVATTTPTVQPTPPTNTAERALLQQIADAINAVTA